MAAFLLSVGETWPRIGSMVAFWLSVGVSGSEHFFSLFLFLFRDPYLLFLFLSSVPGSAPEREHGRLFALCRRGFIPD